MAVITKDRFEEILKNAPSGTTREQLNSELQKRGNTIQDSTTVTQNDTGGGINLGQAIGQFFGPRGFLGGIANTAANVGSLITGRPGALPQVAQSVNEVFRGGKGAVTPAGIAIQGALGITPGFNRTPLRQATAPVTGPQKAGRLTENIAEFFIPSGTASKLALKGLPLTQKLGKLALAGGREATDLAARTYAQTGSPSESMMAGAIGSAFPFAGALLGGAIKGAGGLTTEILGKTTGAGGGAIKLAFDRPAQFLDALRKTSTEAIIPIVEKAKSAMGDIAAKRMTEYRNALSKLKDIPQAFSLTPVKTAVKDITEQFAIRVKSGVPDFSKSTITSSGDQGLITKAMQDIQNWGKIPSDLAITGIDTLKRRLGDYVDSATSNEARKVLTTMTNSVRNVLDSVPQYKSMTSAYRTAKQFEDELAKALSLGDKASIDTAARKLSTILKQNNEYRKQLVQQLEESVGGTLTTDIAANALHPLAPRGLTGVLAPTLGAGVGASVGFGGIFSPGFLATAAMFSPRLMGEVAAYSGLAVKELQKLPIKQLQTIIEGILSKTINSARNQ